MASNDSGAALQPEPSENDPQLADIEPFQGAEVMAWRIKAHPHPMRIVDMTFGGFVLIFFSYFLYGEFYESESDREFTRITSVCSMCFVLLFWLVVARKKTVYNYVITHAGGWVEYWQHYWVYTPYVFKGISVFFFVAVLTMILIEPSFVWALAGPAAMAAASASGLLKWENEISHSSFKWDRPHLIFVDRKRGLVILQRRYDPDIPFEENYLYFQTFLPKDRLDEFLSLAKLYAPSNVDYEEGRCYE